MSLLCSKPPEAPASPREEVKVLPWPTRPTFLLLLLLFLIILELNHCLLLAIFCIPQAGSTPGPLHWLFSLPGTPPPWDQHRLSLTFFRALRRRAHHGCPVLPVSFTLLLFSCRSHHWLEFFMSICSLSVFPSGMESSMRPRPWSAVCPAICPGLRTVPGTG